MKLLFGLPADSNNYHLLRNQPTTAMRIRRNLRCWGKRLTLCVAFLALIPGSILLALNMNNSGGRIARQLLAYVGVANSMKQKSSGPLVYRYGVGNDTLVVRDGQHSLYADRVSSLSDASVRILYRQHCSSRLEITADCGATLLTKRQSGSAADNWNLCAVGPYALRPPACLVFSFGRRAKSWKFEDTLADRHKCQVFAFDPYMPPKYQVEDQNPYRLPEGLQGSEATTSWFAESYSGHLKRFKCQELPIDSLKLDIGESAWPALEAAASDRSLENVKQLLLSTPLMKNASLDQMKLEITVLTQLHRLGFRLWRQEFSEVPAAIHDDASHIRRLYFVNSNFAQLQQQTSANDHELRAFASQLPDPFASLGVVRLHGYEEFNRVRFQMPTANLVGATFRQLTRQAHFHCPNSRRIGECDVCVSGPFDIRRRPCVVLSFGVRNERVDFEEKLANSFKCSVHLVDRVKLQDQPKKVDNSISSSGIQFHRAGLSPNGDSVDESNGLHLLTLCSMFNNLGLSAPKAVDILKMDWASDKEWLILDRAVKDGCLSRVRQLVVRPHLINEGLHMSAYYQGALRTLARIFDFGFANWNLAAGAAAAGGFEATKPSNDLYFINKNVA